MHTDLKEFEKKVPTKVRKVLSEISSGGYVPTLVGGVVRDYFLSSEMGTDWDIEISHPRLPWDLPHWKDFGKSLSKFGKVTFLPYEIVRIKVDEFELELSPPRKESFSEEDHHKNFTADYDLSLAFEEAIKRRDFTVNAMGLRFHPRGEWELLDPTGGLLHLREKILHPVSEDFSRDPVRFLRAIRFKLRLGFDFSPTLQTKLSSMKAGGYSHAYFWSELQKSKRPVKFLKEVLKQKESHPELPLPLSPADLPKLEGMEKIMEDVGRQESWMVALEWMGISSESWVEYFCLGHDSSKRIARWAQSSRLFTQRHPEDFHGEFEEIVMKQEFVELFDWYFTTKQILQKHPQVNLLKMIEEFLPEWIHLFRFEPVKDVKHIDPPLRAKYQVWNLCQRL